MNNRKSDITSPLGKSAKEYILSNFLPDISQADVITGYRADDSYFSFAEDFISNTISLRDMNAAMKLGNLGAQVVLISERSFSQIEFMGYEVADYHEYYFRRSKRDLEARQSYSSRKKSLDQLIDDIYVLDIMREAMGIDDPRLQSAISE